jgi:hypothetical protein
MTPPWQTWPWDRRGRTRTFPSAFRRGSVTPATHTCNTPQYFFFEFLCISFVKMLTGWRIVVRITSPFVLIAFVLYCSAKSFLRANIRTQDYSYHTAVLRRKSSPQTDYTVDSHLVSEFSNSTKKKRHPGPVLSRPLPEVLLN